jgi:aminoglycoside 6'-N-acetyltransferase I
MTFTVRRCSEDDIDDWVDLRLALWPDAGREEHRKEIVELLLTRDGDAANVIARGGDGTAAGFAEATLRRDYVNGCDTSPVAFLEGLYVRSDCRREGVARQLCRAIEEWARGLGCAEFGSDVLLDNPTSQRMHEALGFEERERVVFYRKRLSSD